MRKRKRRKVTIEKRHIKFEVQISWIPSRNPIKQPPKLIKGSLTNQSEGWVEIHRKEVINSNEEFISVKVIDKEIVEKREIAARINIRTEKISQE